MLNIPNTVKALFERDGVHKNFRVHFPNGEFSDITNENVVQESLKFTESLCSQSTFKFGLAEASVLEFETVGIGNMYGMTIEASIEIDTTSLSAAEITAIQNDPGDGTIVLAASSDIGHGFYRVPLGTFKVDSCPRDHQAMAHRKVTAYTTLLHNMSYRKSQFERGMASIYSHYTKRKIDVYSQLIERIGYIYPQYMADNFTKTLLFDSNNMSQTSYTGSSLLIGELVDNHRIKMELTVLRTNLSYRPVINELWEINVGNFDFAGALRFINNAKSVYGEGVDKVMNPVGYFSEYAVVTGKTSYETDYGVNYHRYLTMKEDQPAAYVYNSYQYYYDLNKFGDGQFYLTFPIYARIEVTDNYGTVLDSFETTATEMPSVYKFTPINAYPSITLLCEPVEEFEYIENNIKYKGYRYDFFSSDFSNFFSSSVELTAEFVKEKRITEGFDFIHLNNSSPLSILPETYEQMWWDEYDVDPIGTVTVTYIDGSDEEADAEITIGSGQSVYSMQENLVLNSLSNQSLSAVKTLINTYFKPYIQTVNFTPIDLTMHGLPWIEAGDALEIEAEDGTIVETYALRIEMNGIQHLQMNIVSEGGEIIEGVS